MREEDEIRAAVIALAEAQAAGEDIADALPHGEALAAAGAAADGEAVDDALDPEQAREEAIAAVLDAARAASRASRLSCPCEWEAAGLVPPSMTPEDLEMAVYDALMEFGDPSGSRDAGDVEGPDAGAAPRRAANKHVKSAFSSSNGRPVGASPFKRKAVSADAAEVGTERSAKAKPSGEAECVDRASSATEEDVQGAGGCPDRASSAANETAQWAVSQSEDCLSESGYPAAPPQGESQQHRPQIVFLAPQGRPFDDAYADKLAAADHLLFICGHYEGIDERVYALADHVISLGDYVLTSGELASMVVIDAAVRKLPGVLGAAEGPVDESFTSGLLEYPQYTRPADFRGMAVPEVLTSGNHAAIARCRREQSLARTAAARPDLIAAAEAAGRLTPADQKFLKLLEPASTGAAEGVS